jgi:hypothetical protein
MKSSHQCPKCRGRKLWVIERVHRLDIFGKCGGRTAVVPVSLTAGSKVERGALFDGIKNQRIGTVECWACDACGYVEYYAHGMDQLREAAKDETSGVRLVDGTAPAQGAHR